MVIVSILMFEQRKYIVYYYLQKLKQNTANLVN
jgi:hypothetical protein